MKKLSIIFVVLALLAVGSVFLYMISGKIDQEPTAVNQQEHGPAKYSPEWFVQLLDRVELPNTKPIETAPTIKGSEDADQRIREIAERRGYQLETVATGELVDLEQVRVQAPVVEVWNQMKKSAQAEAGVSLTLISGYRSVESQRGIFNNRLDEQSKKVAGRTYSNSEIATGAADAVIEQVLVESSPPGYSQHHSGYAIDIEDTSSGKAFDQFSQTKGFEWLSKNNYENARRLGFIPSYPEGASNLGPNPEAWHIVWVGSHNIQ